jgi:hypothetical protein
MPLGGMARRYPTRYAVFCIFAGPLEIYGMTTNITSPALYALGTLTTGFSFGVIAIFVAVSLTLRKRGHLPYDRGATASGGPAPPCRRERPGP